MTTISHRQPLKQFTVIVMSICTSVRVDWQVHVDDPDGIAHSNLSSVYWGIS